MFKVPRNVSSTSDNPLLPEKNLSEVRIVSPYAGKTFAPDKDQTAKNQTTLKVKAAVDAPDGIFDFKGRAAEKVDPPTVEIGIDQNQHRKLEEGDPVEIRRSDRQVTVTAKSLSPDGSLELLTDVGDFDVTLSSGLTNRRVNLLGGLRIDGTTSWDIDNLKEVVLDGAAPDVRVDFPPQPGLLPFDDKKRGQDPQVISGEDLLVHVFMYKEAANLELSGVKTVQAAFATEKTKDSKPGKPETGEPDGKGGWIVKLSTKDEKLGLGKRYIRITATDKVDNESEPRFEPVEIISKPANAAQAPANADNAKNPALANEVSGKVQFGDTGVASKVELIAALGPPIKPADTDANGAFKFTNVPPGKYTLKATTIEAQQNYKRKADKEIDVPPKPQKFAPINVKVK